MENGSSEAPLPHSCHVHKSQAAVTKLFTFLYSLLIFSFISFRLSSSSSSYPLLPWLLVFSSELILFFLSLLNLSYRFRPVSRTAFPERLLDHQVKVLPAIDVFVFTADPKREPAVEVMNTVISAMALDYPPEKLAVYISDDGGSPVTLTAAKEAVEFARWWVPFCRRYEVLTRCPKAYFGGDGEEVNGGGVGDGFMQERRAMETLLHRHSTPDRPRISNRRRLRPCSIADADTGENSCRRLRRQIPGGHRCGRGSRSREPDGRGDRIENRMG